MKKIKKIKNFYEIFFSKNKNFSNIFFQHRLARRATFDSSGSLDSLSPLSHFFIATITSKISFVSPDFFACSSLASPFNSTKRGPSKFLKKNDFRYSCSRDRSVLVLPKIELRPVYSLLCMVLEPHSTVIEPLKFF
jgi:hypothetical protein